LFVRKEELDEESIKGNVELLNLIKQAKLHPGEPQIMKANWAGEISNVVFEGGKVYMKTLVAVHKMEDGKEINMAFANESDGTRRLVDYMPLFYAVTNEEKVYIVDEIERSIHPILIKGIMEKLSQSENASGQLIFSTHESGLLDQDIFRPDEIWFAQKDADQATQLYPLSDFNIHKTANIENGYLNGRYGGIPFLSNLKDLHW
jgi:AAA15 family ATPase/GTPase